MFLHACKTFCSYVGAFRLSGMQPELRRCCEYMSTHLHASVTMEDLRRATGLSAYRINTLFCQELDASPIQYFLAQKVIYGKRLLESTDMPVSQIAELLAFPSQSSFTQRFRKTLACPPRNTGPGKKREHENAPYNTRHCEEADGRRGNLLQFRRKQ